MSSLVHSTKAILNLEGTYKNAPTIQKPMRNVKRLPYYSRQ